MTKSEMDARERAEPTPKSNDLVCPEHLNPLVAAEWGRLVGLYKEFETQVVADLDKDFLMIYCESVVMYTKAMKKLHGGSAVYKSPKDGDFKINPWVKVAQDASNTMLKFGGFLLLNPIARAEAGLAKVKASEDNLSPIARFMKERMGDV
jgi:P27 family predicted phage terminase small subunit